MGMVWGADDDDNDHERLMMTIWGVEIVWWIVK